MLQLRIRQHAVAEDRHRVEIDLTGDGAPRAATSTFDFRLSPQDDEDLRWYLEDFLQYPQDLLRARLFPHFWIRVRMAEPPYRQYRQYRQ